MGCSKDPYPYSDRCCGGSWVRTKKAKTPSQRENRNKRECKERGATECFKQAMENDARDSSPHRANIIRRCGGVRIATTTREEYNRDRRLLTAKLKNMTTVKHLADKLVARERRASRKPRGFYNETCMANRAAGRTTRVTTGRRK